MKFFKNLRTQKKLKKELQNDSGAYKARIKWNDNEWLVVENVGYKGKEYLYIIADISEKIETTDNFQENIVIEFIYDTGNGGYANVTDVELKSKLSAMVATKAQYKYLSKQVENIHMGWVIVNKII